jgi:hypothetical protein
MKSIVIVAIIAAVITFTGCVDPNGVTNEFLKAYYSGEYTVAYDLLREINGSPNTFDDEIQAAAFAMAMRFKEKGDLDRASFCLVVIHKDNIKKFLILYGEGDIILWED